MLKKDDKVLDKKIAQNVFSWSRKIDKSKIKIF